MTITRVTCDLTGSEGEEEALVRVLLQKGPHSLPHPLVALVNQLLSEVAVNLLRGDLLFRWQSDIIKVGDLRGQTRWDSPLGKPTLKQQNKQFAFMPRMFFTPTRLLCGACRAKEGLQGAKEGL